MEKTNTSLKSVTITAVTIIFSCFQTWAKYNIQKFDIRDGLQLHNEHHTGQIRLSVVCK